MNRDFELGWRETDFCEFWFLACALDFDLEFDSVLGFTLVLNAIGPDGCLVKGVGSKRNRVPIALRNSIIEIE